MLDLEPHLPALLRRARSLTPSETQARDLLQDTVARALAKEHTFEVGTNLQAWLMTVMRNLRVTEVATAHRDPMKFLDEREITAHSRDDLDLRRLTSEVILALGRLPAVQRRSIILVTLGHDYDEVAAIEHVPTGTVRSRIARGRQTLRRQFA